MLNGRIAQNSAWIIGCRLVQAVLALIVNMLTARYLGPSNYGTISYAASIVAFVTPVMQLGLTNILVQEFILTPEKEGEILGTSLVLCFISSIACILGVFTFVFFVNAGETETIVVCVLYSIMLIFQSFEQVQYWFQAQLKSKYVSLATLAAYVIVAAYKIYLLASGKNVRWFALSYSLDYLLISFILLVQYRRLGGKRLRFSGDQAKYMLSKSRYYIISSMMTVIYAQTDRIMLKNYIDSSAVGYYTAATTIAGLSSFVFSAIIDSFRPVILENSKRNKDLYEKYLITLFSIVIYLSLAQSVIMTLGAKYFVWILYGSGYETSILALQIVVWYTTFSYIGPVRNIWILAEDKHKYLWILNLAGAGGNVILNIILIPILGINGAAIASLITQFFTNVVMNEIVKAIRPVNRYIIRSLNPNNLLSLLKRKSK